MPSIIWGELFLTHAQDYALHNDHDPASDSAVHPHTSVFSAIQRELYDWRLWTGRGLVLAFAALAGLTVVAFTWMTETAFEHFTEFRIGYWWGPLLWIPLSTAAIVWLTRKFAPGAEG